MTSFAELGLQPDLLRAITDLGYEEPTAIQEQAIPLLLAGHDLMGQAQTGTGKTAAFALPLLSALYAEDTAVQALVIVPTRELALQVAGAIHDLGAHLAVRVLPIYGGQDYGRQISRLRQGVPVVVGTPGRMLDLIRRGVLDLSGVRVLVLDEADEMLSMGFSEDIELILQATPDERQTALFSATLPETIRRLGDRYLRSPEMIAIAPEQVTVENIEQRYYLLRESDKLAAMVRLLALEPVTGALVFTRTKAGAAQLADALLAVGLPADALHGDLPQQVRETLLGRFRSGQIKVLVATDIAARGLDIEGISHVFNYDLPLDHEYYVHRVGRTGRAGRAGVAISLVTPQEHWRLRRIEAYTRELIPLASLPGARAVQAHRDQQFLQGITDQLAAQELAPERALVAEWLAGGGDPLDLAAAVIRLARANELTLSAEEITAPMLQTAPRRGSRPPSAGPAAPRQSSRRPDRGREPGMVRLLLNLGRANALRPADIVGAIAGTANIPGQAIGAIVIHQRRTLIDVSAQHAEQVLLAMEGWRLRGQAASLQRAD
jgi:ATP-dependent RNA helicase DeaD